MKARSLAPVTELALSHLVSKEDTWSVRRVRNGLTQGERSIHLLCRALLSCPGFCLLHSTYSQGDSAANMTSCVQLFSPV